jgi:hypothetical protein
MCDTQITLNVIKVLIRKRVSSLKVTKKILEGYDCNLITKRNFQIMIKHIFHFDIIKKRKEWSLKVQPKFVSCHLKMGSKEHPIYNL